jgi:RNA polymerase sigma-70 factor, ECF subfamily
MAAPAVTHEELRPLLFSLAYRMVGSVSEAEDLVQEAFLRWHRAGGEIGNAKAFLTTVVTRLAIDHLRSARVRREAYVGPWLHEPLVDERAPGPAQRVEDDETLSLAFLALIERLSPVERAVYLLHELFGYGHDEIAEVVGKSGAATRQILVRARRHVEQGRPRFEPSRSEREALLARFLDACRAGDVGALVELLAADATSYADGGGRARATLLPIYGADKVARLWASIADPARSGPYSLGAADVNGQPGAVAVAPDGGVIGVLTLAVAAGRIESVWAVVNPDKLARVQVAAAAGQAAAT